jgi:hypothetical protein
VTAKPARQATRTMTRSRVKRSESTPRHVHVTSAPCFLAPRPVVPQVPRTLVP